MKFQETSSLYTLNKSTYTNLRWIAHLGQLFAILIVQLYLEFNFSYFYCSVIVFIRALTNLFLQFIVRIPQ